MDIFDVHGQVIDDYRAFTSSFVDVRHSRIREFVNAQLDSGNQWPSPWLSLNPSFESGGSIPSLVKSGLLDPENEKIFKIKEDPESLIGKTMTLHRHQTEAISAAKTGKSYVLTTGTGSGKSLSYIIPIVDSVLQSTAANGGRRLPGVKAIIVYPMNALANSQLGELRKFLKHGYPDGSEPKASQTIAKDRKVSQCDKTQKIEKQFNEFWEVYNFKHNKEQSRKAFANALKIIKFDDLIEAVKKYNSVRKEGFIFKPNNWLNGKHWDDEYQNNPPQEEEQADKEEFYKAWVNCYCTKPAYKDSKIFKDFVQECKAEMTAKTFEAWFQLNLMDVKSDSIIFETEKEFIIDALMGENNHCMNGKAKDIIFKVTKKHFGNKNLVFQYMKNGIFLQKEYKLN